MGDIADWTIAQGMDAYGGGWFNDPKPTRYVNRPVSRVVTETENAWLVETKRGHHYWYPKSVCTLRGNTLSVPDWIKPERVTPVRQHTNTITSHLKK